MTRALPRTDARLPERILRLAGRAPGSIVLRAGGLAAAYVFLDRLAALTDILDGRTVPAWHPAGLALAAMLLWGPALWPGVLVGALVANVVVGIPAVPAALLAVASTAGPTAGVALLRRAGLRPQLDRLIDVPLLVIAAVAAGAIAATVGLAGLAADGVTGSRLVLDWSIWTMADAGSTFVIGSVLLSWFSRPVVDQIRDRPLESAIALVSAAAVAAVLFFDVFDLRASGEAVAFPVIPVLVWVAFRVGPRGTALASMVVAVFAVAATDRGLGPFVGTSREASVFYVVVFMGLTAATAAAVAAATSERDGAARALAAERRSLAERAAILRRLVSYSGRISGVLSVEELYPLCVAALDGVISADLVGLTVIERASGAYVVRAEKGSAGSVGRTIEPGTGPAGRAIRDGRLVRMSPYRRPDFPPSMRDLNAAEEYADAVGVPLVREGAVIGSLTVARIDPATRFSDLELEALALLADEITLATANALLHGDVAELAIHDPLTGLHNRRYFDDVLPQLLATRARLPGELPPVSAILFDLDHFGEFNMAHGHQAGDEALRVFAAVLRRRLRAADLVARYGGEEFIAILVGANRAAAITVADEIRRSLAQTPVHDLDGVPASITVSAGCATRAEAELAGEQLIASADIALVMAKRAGRNQVVGA